MAEDFGWFGSIGVYPQAASAQRWGALVLKHGKAGAYAIAAEGKARREAAADDSFFSSGIGRVLAYVGVGATLFGVGVLTGMLPGWKLAVAMNTLANVWGTGHAARMLAKDFPSWGVAERIARAGYVTSILSWTGFGVGLALGIRNPFSRAGAINALKWSVTGWL